MQRSDWFALVVAIITLGAGAFMNTFPTGGHPSTRNPIDGRRCGRPGRLVCSGTATARHRPKISPYSDTNHDVPLIDAIWRVFMGVWDEGHKVEMGDDPNRYPVLD
jgi:hypothetical protein